MRESRSSKSRLNFGRQLSPGSGNRSLTIACSGLRAQVRLLADAGRCGHDLALGAAPANVCARYGEQKLGANLAREAAAWLLFGRTCPMYEGQDPRFGPGTR